MPWESLSWSRLRSPIMKRSHSSSPANLLRSPRSVCDSRKCVTRAHCSTRIASAAISNRRTRLCGGVTSAVSCRRASRSQGDFRSQLRNLTNGGLEPAEEEKRTRRALMTPTHAAALLYIGILGLFLIVLSVHVSRLRQRHRVLLGTKGNP